MIKRQPWFIKSVAGTAAATLKLWIRTLRYDYRPQGRRLEPGRTGDDRFIYAMWHEYLLLPILQYAHPEVHVLISRSGDGQLLSELCRRLHIPVVRGSTSRGGAEAVRRMLRAGCRTHLALTPDGPRGPRRRVQQGLIYLASRSGLPIVPVGFGLDQPWRLASWDCFALPRPRSRAVCVTAAPIAIPPDLEDEQLETYRQAVEQAMHDMTAAAEGWAAKAA